MTIKKNEADPRVVRTRRLLQDAFASLIQEKDFESITVRDIAERATVNRATFYAHFVDKFEMLEARLMESFMTIINRRISGHEVLNEETIQSIFLGVCEFHKGLSTMCKRRNTSLVPVFEIQIKEKNSNDTSFLYRQRQDASDSKRAILNKYCFYHVKLGDVWGGLCLEQ